MDSEPYMQLDHPNCIPTVIDGIPSQSLSESHLRTSLLPLNIQDDCMLALPLIPSLQGQSFKDIHANKTVSYDGLFNRGNFDLQELCLGGATFGSGSLPTILASRNGFNNDANDSVISVQQEVPSESLRAMFSGGCSYASSSSIPTTLNCAYDGSFGELNDKWDHNRFLMQQEMNWRASTSGLEPIRFNGSPVATNEWVVPSAENVCTSHPYGTSRSHNELSLSLATCGPSFASDLSCSGVIHSSQSQTRLGSEHSSQCSKELSLGCTSNNRSVQFSPIISGSRYFSVLQQILSEISRYSLDSLDKTSQNSDNLVNSCSNLPFSTINYDPGSSFKDTDEFHDNDGSIEVPAGSSKRSQMLALLQMVDDRYNRCLDEIHTVISAFHAATELDPQLHSCFALQKISFFYKNLRERISNQILAMGMDNGSVRESGISLDKSFIHKQWKLQQLKRKDQLWRPQRGLPERSVSVLRAWMFDNFLHPYPKDAEKHLLAIKSGLTRSQVSNWFINARVRLWKPLVEDMCAELNRKKGSRQNDGVNNSNNSGSQLRIYDYDQRCRNC